MNSGCRIRKIMSPPIIIIAVSLLIESLVLCQCQFFECICILPILYSSPLGVGHHVHHHHRNPSHQSQHRNQNLHLLLDNLNNNYNDLLNQEYLDSTLDVVLPIGSGSVTEEVGRYLPSQTPPPSPAAAPSCSSLWEIQAEYHGETTGLPSDPEDHPVHLPASSSVTQESRIKISSSFVDRLSSQLSSLSGLNQRGSSGSIGFNETALHYGSQGNLSQPLAAAPSSDQREPQPELLSPLLDPTSMQLGHSFSSSHSRGSTLQPTSSTYSRSFSSYNSRPLFTRSHSVPEHSSSAVDHTKTSALDPNFPLDSEVEELFLEAAAASLDNPLPITPSVVLSNQHQRLLQHQPSSKLTSLRSDDHLYYARSTPQPPIAASAVPSLISDRLGLRSHSSELPTTERAAAARDHLSLLNADLQAAANASRRLTARHAQARQLRQLKAEGPLTLGRSLQLVTENAGRFRGDRNTGSAAAAANLSSKYLNRGVRFDGSDPDHLLHSSLGLLALEDAWMSVEDVRSGRWARWDALVKQESQDSATRDSGIETGSCFTSSEDSNRDVTNHYYHKKVVYHLLLLISATIPKLYPSSRIFLLLCSILVLT